MKKLLQVFLVLFITLSLTAQTKYDSRADIPAKYKWNFSDIYQNWDEWQKGFDQLGKMMDELAGLKGTLANGPEALYKVQKLNDDLGVLSYRVYRYPQLQRDANTKDQDVSAKLQQVQILFSQFGTATSWINPEMLQIPWETMKKWLDEDKNLKPYRFGIEDLYRQQAHVLDEEKEKLLSYYSQLNGTPSDIYGELSTSDIDFPTVTLSTGEERKMTAGNYGLTLATDTVQADRKLAFETHYNVYKANENTYAKIYNAVCQADWANAQARNYRSSLESYLDGDNVPVSVYENLVNVVRENCGSLQKFHKLRKRVLGLEKYWAYDGSINLTDFNKTYDYDQATKYVMESVAPLGSDYQAKLSKAFNGGWIDVYETDGKRSGAYSANVYGVHPYMLMNYSGIMRDVFTLGHELGHTMHTVLANESQPFSTSDYKIFVAEVASTFNEDLLLDYMLKKSNDPNERIALLTQAINNLTGTFYFQTLLADFELQAHKMVEEGKPITAQVLDKLMKDIYLDYYGDSMEEDDLLYRVWARIPHMYRTPFYVYQYATCYASSAQLYKEFSEAQGAEKDAVRTKYLNMLKSGGSDYPMELLRKAGVDLTKPETFLAVTQQMDKLVTQLEKELAAIGK